MGRGHIYRYLKTHPNLGVCSCRAKAGWCRCRALVDCITNTCGGRREPDRTNKWKAQLAIALGAERYERHDARRGYRNGVKPRTLTGPTGPLALTLPRATVGAPGREWRSTIVPRYQRRMREVNEAVIATYLAGGNQRRIRGAPRPSPLATTPSQDA